MGLLTWLFGNEKKERKKAKKRAKRWDNNQIRPTDPDVVYEAARNARNHVHQKVMSAQTPESEVPRWKALRTHWQAEMDTAKKKINRERKLLGKPAWHDPREAGKAGYYEW